MHYYKFNIGDFDKITRHLTILERAIFRDLLDLYIKNEEAIISDQKRLERLLCIKSKAEKEALKNVLDDFFVLIDDRYHSDFCQSILDETILRTEAARENGKKGGRPSKPNIVQSLNDVKAKTIQIASNAKANQNPNENQIKPNENLLENYPITHKPQSNKPLNISFEEFWETYDKKVGDKSKIEIKWNKLTVTERIAVMKHIVLYKESQPDKQYRKNPETYLNNKSWNDEIISRTSHENNRSNNSQFKPEQETYENGLMAEYEAFYGKSSPSSNGQIDSRNVYSLENAI